MNQRISELAKMFAAAKEELAKREAFAKEQAGVVAELETQLFDALENEGLRSTKIDGLGTFSLNDLAWAKIIDREQALTWAESYKPELLTLNHQQLSVLVRDFIRGEGEMPAGVDFTTSRKISWRKAS